MQILKAGDMELEIVTAIAGPVEYQGMIVDSVRLVLPGDITEDEIMTLVERPWNILSATGAFIKTHSGYNFPHEYSITFLKLPEQAKLMVELSNAIDEISAARQQAELNAAQAAAATLKAQEAESKMIAMIEAMKYAGIDPDALIQANIARAVKAFNASGTVG